MRSRDPRNITRPSAEPDSLRPTGCLSGYARLLPYPTSNVSSHLCRSARPTGSLPSESVGIYTIQYLDLVNTQSYSRIPPVSLVAAAAKYSTYWQPPQ